MSCVIGSYGSQSQHIATQASHFLAKVPQVRLCCKHSGFCCKGRDCLLALVPIHQETSSAVVRPANTCMETRLNECYECEECGTFYSVFYPPREHNSIFIILSFKGGTHAKTSVMSILFIDNYMNSSCDASRATIYGVVFL